MNHKMIPMILLLITLLLSGCSNFVDYSVYHTDIEIINDTDVSQLFSIYSSSEGTVPEIADRIRDVEVPPNSSRTITFSWIPGDITYPSIYTTEDMVRFYAEYRSHNLENDNIIEDEIYVLIKSNSSFQITLFDSQLKSRYSAEEFNSLYIENINSQIDLDIIRDLYFQSAPEEDWNIRSLNNYLNDPELSFEEELNQRIEPILTTYSIVPGNHYISVGEEIE